MLLKNMKDELGVLENQLNALNNMSMILGEKPNKKSLAEIAEVTKQVSTRIELLRKGIDNVELQIDAVARQLSDPKQNLSFVQMVSGYHQKDQERKSQAPDIPFHSALSTDSLPKPFTQLRDAKAIPPQSAASSVDSIPLAADSTANTSKPRG